MSEKSPEIGKSVNAGGIATNYHERGSGFPVIMYHGSGPGVSAFANWRLNMDALAETHHVLAPDAVGFGFTERPEGIAYTMDVWVKHAIDFMDAMEIPQADLVGNSFGGALALAITVRHPDRVRRLVLMGAVGVGFELTPALDFGWGYTPSVENMEQMLKSFAYNRSLITPDLAKMRYEASLRPGVQEAYAAMFPAPRQRWIEALASPEDKIREVAKPTLILQGRDDQIIPRSVAIRLHELIEDSQLHMFGKCGHWVQVEHAARFNVLVPQFLNEA